MVEKKKIEIIFIPKLDTSGFNRSTIGMKDGLVSFLINVLLNVISANSEVDLDFSKKRINSKKQPYEMTDKWETMTATRLNLPLMRPAIR